MEQAIKQAIKGGWKEFENSDNNTVSYYTNTVVKYQLLLDPKFWQALGKAEGWPKYIDTTWPNEEGGYHQDLSWREYWHRFIDSLAQEESPDEFFEKLLTKQN